MNKGTENSQTIYNFLSTGIISGINFLTIPVFTRVLGAEHYGYAALYISWVSLLTCIMGFKTQSALGVGKYNYRERYTEFRSCTLVLGSLISASIVFIGLLLLGPLSKVMGFPREIIALLLITSFGHYVVDFTQLAFIYEKKAKINFIISVSISISTVVLTLLILKYCSRLELYLARVLGVSLPYILVPIILWDIIFRADPSAFDLEYWKFSLSLGAPIVFHALSQTVLGQSDRIMLNGFGYSGSPVGIYSFFHTYTNIVTTILNALNTSWCPFYYDYLDSNNIDLIERKSNNYLELFTVITCGFLLLSREVCYIFASKEYMVGMNVLPIFVLAIYFTFMYQFPVNYEFFHKKTQIVAVGTCIAALMNIILNAILIPTYGIYGAAVATAISYMALVVIHYVLVKACIKTPFHYKLLTGIKYLIPVIIAMIIFYAFQKLWIIRWGLGFIVGIAELARIIIRRSVF